MIKKNFKVGVINLKNNEKYYSLGTPTDYFKFLREFGHNNINYLHAGSIIIK